MKYLNDNKNFLSNIYIKKLAHTRVQFSESPSSLDETSSNIKYSIIQNTNSVKNNTKFL